MSATTGDYQALIQGDAALAYHYDFDGATDAIRLEDKVGVADINQSVGLTLPTLGAAGFDGTSDAADFDGTDQRISTAATAVTLNATSFTSEVIVRLDADGSAGRYIFHANEGAGADRTLMAIQGFGANLDGQDVSAAIGPGTFGPGAEYVAGGGIVPGHWYFLAATFTNGAGTTDMQAYVADLTAGDTVLAATTPVTESDGNYNTDATSLWAGGPWFGDLFHLDGATDELAIFDGALSQATIQSHLSALTGVFVEVPELTLQINATTGAMSIVNPGADPTVDTMFDLDGYVIESAALPSGSLNPGGFTGLVGAGETGWEIVDPTTAELSELNLDFSTLFAEGDSISLGTGYTPGAADDPGLTFEYTVVGSEDTIFGLVEYVTSTAVAGDYNGDEIVNAADYTIWRDTLGSMTDLRANGDDSGASQGVVDQADYTYWKARFGNTSGSGSLSGASAVPEPATCLLLCMTIPALALWARRKRANETELG